MTDGQRGFVFGMVFALVASIGFALLQPQPEPERIIVEIPVPIEAPAPSCPAPSAPLVVPAAAPRTCRECACISDVEAWAYATRRR